MALPLAPLFVALCIADQSWLAELKAPREAILPSSEKAAFCRSQVALHHLDENLQADAARAANQATAITCTDELEGTATGVGTTLPLAHASAVNRCVVLSCEKMKSSTERLNDEDRQNLRSLWYNEGLTEPEIAAKLGELEKLPFPKRHDCLENSKAGFMSSYMVWDLCVYRGYTCGTREERRP